MKRIVVVSFVVLIANAAFCQQPFEEYGYKVKVATLSNGKYQEFFDQDSLIQIGSVIIDQYTGKVVSFVTVDTVYSEATLQPELVSRWLSPDPLSEKYYSISPYTYAANNPIVFVDPDGQEIFVYNWVEGKDGKDGHWEKGHMNKDTEKALEAFAKTKEGFAFLSQYATAGQKIGSVEFKEDGQFADQNLNYREYDRDISRRGDTEFIDEGKSMSVDIRLNTHHMDKENGKERYAMTIGHESLLHADPYDNKIMTGFQEGKKTGDWKSHNQAMSDWRRQSGEYGANDHSRYINGQNSQQFNSFISHLKTILNPKAVEAAKREHDAQYQTLIKKK